MRSLAGRRPHAVSLPRCLPRIHLSTDWKQINSHVLSDEFGALPNVPEQKAMPGIELILSWHGAQPVISVLCWGYCTSPLQPPNGSHHEPRQKVTGRNASPFITRTGRTTSNFHTSSVSTSQALEGGYVSDLSGSI